MSWYSRVYLSSNHWRTFQYKIKLLRKVCQACGTADNLAVHHLNYDNLWREKDEDVMVLCKACHKLTHI